MRIASNTPNLAGAPANAPVEQNPNSWAWNEPAQTEGLFTNENFMRLLLYTLPLIIVVCSVLSFLLLPSHDVWHGTFLLSVALAVPAVLFFGLGLYQYWCSRQPVAQRNRQQRYAANIWLTLQHIRLERLNVWDRLALLMCGIMVIGSFTLFLVIDRNSRQTVQPQAGSIPVLAAQTLTNPPVTATVLPAPRSATAGAQLNKLAEKLAPVQERYRARYGTYAPSMKQLLTFDRTAPQQPGTTVSRLASTSVRDDGWVLQQGARQLVHFNRLPAGVFLAPTRPQTGNQ